MAESSSWTEHVIRGLGSSTRHNALAYGYSLATASTTLGFRRRVREEPPIVRALGSSLRFVSITGAIAFAWLLGWALGGWPAWLLGGFAASGLYLVLSALELAFARVVHPVLPVDDLEEPEEAADEPE